MEKRKNGTGFLYMHVFPFLKISDLINLIHLASKNDFGWRINKFEVANSLNL